MHYYFRRIWITKLCILVHLWVLMFLWISFLYEAIFLFGNILRSLYIKMKYIEQWIHWTQNGHRIFPKEPLIWKNGKWKEPFFSIFGFAKIVHPKKLFIKCLTWCTFQFKKFWIFRKLGLSWEKSEKCIC